MLDSYRDRVEELLDAGCTFADISDHMAEEEQIYVEPTTVAYFVRSRKLSSKVTQGCRNNRIEYRSVQSASTDIWSRTSTKSRAFISAPRYGPESIVAASPVR